MVAVRNSAKNYTKKKRKKHPRMSRRVHQVIPNEVCLANFKTGKDKMVFYFVSKYLKKAAVTYVHCLFSPIVAGAFYEVKYLVHCLYHWFYFSQSDNAIQNLRHIKINLDDYTQFMIGQSRLTSEGGHTEVNTASSKNKRCKLAKPVRILIIPWKKNNWIWLSRFRDRFIA